MVTSCSFTSHRSISALMLINGKLNIHVTLCLIKGHVCLLWQMSQLFGLRVTALRLIFAWSFGYCVSFVMCVVWMKSWSAAALKQTAVEFTLLLRHWWAFFILFFLIKVYWTLGLCSASLSSTSTLIQKSPNIPTGSWAEQSGGCDHRALLLDAELLRCSRWVPGQCEESCCSEIEPRLLCFDKSCSAGLRSVLVFSKCSPPLWSVRLPPSQRRSHWMPWPGLVAVCDAVDVDVCLLFSLTQLSPSTSLVLYNTIYIIYEYFVCHKSEL